MGCCFSQPAGPNAPYPGGAPSGSARAINSPRLRPSIADEGGSRSPRAAAHPGSSRRRHRDQQPLDQHIDKPLRLHVWYSKDRAWTRAQLDRERIEFFDTRVTGRPEIWQTLRAALEVLWENDAARRLATAPSTATEEESEQGDDEDDSHDVDVTALATAQSILKAAEITLPTGNLANGVYDQLGHYYALPEWIVRDPVNVAKQEEDDVEDARRDEELDEDRKGGALASTAAVAGRETADAEEALRRREEKGKAVVDERQRIRVRARLSENAKDVVIRVGSDDTVRVAALRILQESGLKDKAVRVKLVYLGKFLKENATLTSQGYQKEHIVNAFVFPVRH